MGKKICLISTVSITMKTFILPIAEELAHQDVDVTLICNQDDCMHDLCRENGVSFFPVPMGRGVNLIGIKAIIALKKHFKEAQYDLVQYCTPNAACYASFAAKQARVPVRLYCQWGIRYVGFSGLRRKIFKLIEKKTCKNSTTIRAVSRKNMEFAINEKLYTQEKVKVIGNGGTIGVDMDLFDISRKQCINDEMRKRYNIDPEEFVFGFCGRLSKDKGSDELLSAFKTIHEENSQTKLFIIGDVEMSTGINMDLLSWAQMTDSVICTGAIPRELIHRQYAIMNVLVHPTYREGFGMVIQEAGAYGIPCITTNIPGASEVMVEGESCLLIEPRNIPMLVIKMRELLNDRQRTKELGEKAFLRTKELYNRKTMLEFQKRDYLDLLNL